jgi:hypothetical protein
VGVMKRTKINFFQSLDTQVWLNKKMLLSVIDELEKQPVKKKGFIKKLREEIGKCERQ